MIADISEKRGESTEEWPNAKSRDTNMNAIDTGTADC